MTKPTLTPDIQITAPAWRQIRGLRARMQKAAQATWACLPAELRFSSCATILLATDAKVRQLNFDFRGINKPTNVLSFPQFLPQELRRLAKRQKSVELGDMVLAYNRMDSEAKEENKRPIDHATHLVVHGLLHLFGYDHGRDGDAKKMERLEIKILKSMGLPNPYVQTWKKSKNGALNKN